MPEKAEDFHQVDNLAVEQNSRTNKKCKKFLKLFRNIRKENLKTQRVESDLEKKEKKDKKKKFWDMEERKEVFKKNMEGSWADLPNTLKRKKENISEDILSEFHDSDSSEPENSKTSSFGNFGKKEKSYDFSSENIEPLCEYFRQKGEEELDAISLNKTTEEELMKCEKFLNYKKKKNFTSEIIINKSEADAQVYLERIRKLNEDDHEPSRKSDLGNFQIEKKNDTYNLKAAVDEINFLFHDLIAENCEQNDSSTSSDSGTSEPYVNIVFPSSEKEDNEVKVEQYNSENARKETNIKRSISTDSLLNGSVSWASDLSQHEMKFEKIKDEELDILSHETNCILEPKFVGEVVEESPKVLPETETKSCCKETLALLDEISEKKAAKENENVLEDSTNEGTQYSNLMFPVKSNGLLESEHLKRDVDSIKEKQESKQSEGRIIYQELDFIKSKDDVGTDDSGKIEEDAENKSTEEKSEFSDSHLFPAVLSSLSEEQKAKRKSAEAIARELSSQVFNKKTQSPEESPEKKNILTISIKTNCESDASTKSVSSNATKKNAPESKMDAAESVSTDSDLTDVSNERNDRWNVGEKSEWGTVSLQYFSVADWRKAVALGPKRGISSVVMETIVEEPETDTSTKLTVREILRRFEELGNKHFNDKLCLTDDERTATLKQIHQTLKCLEEKVRNFENWSESNFQQQQYHESTRATDFSAGGWTGIGTPQRSAHSLSGRGYNESEEIAQTSVNDGKHSLLQFAIHHFRQSPEKFEMLKTSDGSISGSLKVIEGKSKKSKEKGKGGTKNSSEWTWKEQVDLVKFTAKPIEQSLLQLDPDLSDLAVECFLCLMRYMGDLPMPTDVSEVKCVYTILMHCHKYEQLRDEVYCQLMKQTTNNKSIQQESCQRGWRLFSIVAAYFSSSDTLKPFLFKYLETAAYDKRRAYHGTAMVCLQNLRKTFKYGGRKNVPSVEEITAISAGRNSKRQIYRLPGGTEKVVNTKSTTVVQDVIEELCVMINVVNSQEMEEFSVYCIVEGDTFTMPLAREEYILDVTTELHKNHQVFYLIFCRSVWYFPLRLDSQLYVEVVFNQIAPDYLEGLLLILPGESLEQEIIYDISKIAALLHRAADMTEVPTMKETKFLLPKPALGVRDVKPSQWVNMVQSNWQDCENLTTIQAKAQVLEVLSKWPLFGSSFFAVKKVPEPKDRTDHILALNRNGVHFIDLMTHETLLHYPFSEVISTRKVKSEDGTLFLDMKCGNLMQQRITRLQTDQAHEISRLIRQYITMQQRMGTNQM